MKTLEEISTHFSNVKWSMGSSAFVCCCPAHPDRNPSLKVQEYNGQIYMKCFAGCKTGDILKAVDLQWGDIKEPKVTEKYESKNPFTNSQLLLLGINPTVKIKCMRGWSTSKLQIPVGMDKQIYADGYGIYKPYSISINELWDENPELFHTMIVGKLCSIYAKYCTLYNKRIYKKQCFSALHNNQAVKDSLEYCLKTLRPVYKWYAEREDVLQIALDTLSGLYEPLKNVTCVDVARLFTLLPASLKDKTDIRHPLEKFNYAMYHKHTFAEIPHICWEKDEKRYQIT